MYLNLVKTDFLSLDGSITSYTFTPQTNLNLNNKIRLERIAEFKRTREFSNKELGGHIIYNAAECIIIKNSTPPNINFTLDEKNNIFSFEYNHMDIPIGSISQGHGGRWNLLLPTGWRLTDLYISDPYHPADLVEDKKQFKYLISWDTKNHIQLVEMELRSRRGSFSFIVKGTAKIYQKQSTSLEYLPANELDIGLRNLYEVSSFDGHEKLDKPNRLRELLNCIEVKPGVAGINFDLKEAIKLLFK